MEYSPGVLDLLIKDLETSFKILVFNPGMDKDLLVMNAGERKVIDYIKAKRSRLLKKKGNNHVTQI